MSGCSPVTAATATGVFYLGPTCGKRAARKCAEWMPWGLLSSFDLARLDESTVPIREALLILLIAALPLNIN